MAGQLRRPIFEYVDIEKGFRLGLTFVNGKQYKRYTKEEIDYYKEIFRDILGPVPKKNNGTLFKESYVSCHMTAEKEFYWTAYSNKKHILDGLEKKLKSGNKDNQYIGANSYTMKVKCRDESHIFALKNIVIDIDCHDTKGEDGESSSYLNICRANAFLSWVKEQGNIPIPNLVNYTGRGIQVWYFLEPCSKKLDFLYRTIAERLCEQMQIFADEQGMIVDKVASTGINRIFRIPGTYNPNAHVFSQCIRLSKHRYPLQELQCFLSIDLKKKDFCSAINRNVISRNKKESNSSLQAKCSHPMKEYNSFSVCRRRCRVIESIIRSGREVESRENLLFLYHNFALSVPDMDADLAVYQLNRLFPMPLKDREIKALIKCNTKKEGYLYTDASFFEKAAMTNDEISSYYSFKGSDSTSKNRARDMRRKEKKQKQIQLIQRLYRYGRTKKYKGLDVVPVKEIARKAQCSVNTVYKYTASIRQGIEREKKYQEACTYMKKIRRSKQEEKEKLLQFGLLNSQSALQYYLLVRLQHEITCYGCNILTGIHNESRPPVKKIQRFLEAVESSISGSKIDIIAVVRAGIDLDKHKKIQFITKNRSIYQLLIKVFPDKMRYYFVLKERYMEKQKQQIIQQQEVQVQLMRRQEKMVEEFDRRLEFLRQRKNSDSKKEQGMVSILEGNVYY